jgi:formylglycine-generating enzyme required for sulfatase activity
LIGAVLLGLLLLQPAARAGMATSARSAPKPKAVERAFTGGLAALRAPASRMIRVAKGSFVLGSSEREVLEAVALCGGDPLAYRCNEHTFANELPRLTASTPSFWLDRTEVTVKDYERCVARGACNPRTLVGGARRFTRPELPVTFVSAGDADAYCRFRDARLPSEAEFERAARGQRGRRFPWGNLYHSRASNHGRLGLDSSDPSDGFAELSPVGSFPAGATPDGFLDLAGNASEWSADAYTERHGAPRDPAWGGARSVRGGHFGSAAAFVRGSARQPLAPDEVRPYVGFRCARSAAP